MENWWGKEGGGTFIAHMGNGDTGRQYCIQFREKRKLLKEKRVEGKQS